MNLHYHFQVSEAVLSHLSLEREGRGISLYPLCMDTLFLAASINHGLR